MFAFSLSLSIYIYIEITRELGQNIVDSDFIIVQSLVYV